MCFLKLEDGSGLWEGAQITGRGLGTLSSGLLRAGPGGSDGEAAGVRGTDGQEPTGAGFPLPAGTHVPQGPAGRSPRGLPGGGLWREGDRDGDAAPRRPPRLSPAGRSYAPRRLARIQTQAGGSKKARLGGGRTPGAHARTRGAAGSSRIGLGETQAPGCNLTRRVAGGGGERLPPGGHASTLHSRGG